jgi:hypothetical protein
VTRVPRYTVNVFLDPIDDAWRWSIWRGGGFLCGTGLKATQAAARAAAERAVAAAAKNRPPRRIRVRVFSPRPT